MRNRIGKARAVHMKPKPACLGKCAKCANLIRGINAAILSCVGNRECVRLHPVHVIGNSVERRCGGCRVELCAFAFTKQQLCPVGVKFGRAAFIVLDMRVTVAKDTAVGWSQAGKRERIGGGAAGNPQCGDGRFKKLRKSRVERFAQRVTVIGGINMVGSGQSLKHGWMNRGGIIREKTHSAQWAGVTCASTTVATDNTDFSFNPQRYMILSPCLTTTQIIHARSVLLFF